MNQTQFVHTQDHTPEFYAEVKAMCIRLEMTDPLDMLGVWMSESGVRADAHNPHGNASGLNQLMPQTARGLGWDKTDTTLSMYRHLSATAQLPWVEKYYTPYKGRLRSRGHAYVATFLPKYIAEGTLLLPDTVLAGREGPLGWAYEANAVFDANHDYKITFQELVDAIDRNCRGPRWTEIVARAKGLPLSPVPKPHSFDLRTVLGLQEALSRLGFYKGPIDAIPGRMTRFAIAQFQDIHGLVSDAIPGPLTRAALTEALTALGVAL